MRETVLRGCRLQKRYGEAEIIKEIDIEIYRGDFTVVMGASGSGKSTLLHLLSGMDAVSGGEAQRVAVARAVMAEPEIVFADEPTGALNRANTKVVLELFARIHAEGQTILMVTHDREAARYGNRILYLEDGQICGELSLSHYQGKDSGREKKLERWLEEMGW